MSDPNNDIRFVVPGIEATQVAQSIHGFFTAQKYRMEEGQPGNATYGIGSNLLRILFGAFAKRYKFQVSVADDGQGNVTVTAAKAMSGAMGGVIGHSKMKKETTRIFAGLRQTFGQS